MATDSKLVRDHFLAAAELPAVQRETYLTAHCGGDAELRVADRDNASGEKARDRSGLG